MTALLGYSLSTPSPFVKIQYVLTKSSIKHLSRDQEVSGLSPLVNTLMQKGTAAMVRHHANRGHTHTPPNHCCSVTASIEHAMLEG